MSVQNFGQRARGIPGKPFVFLHFVVTITTVSETSIVYKYTSTQKYLHTRIQKGDSVIPLFTNSYNIL